MTTRELAALDARRAIALLPVGAIEQHGPHLPDAVDACIAQRIVARAPETSMMLHLRPDLVQMEHAGDFVPLAREMADEGFRLLSPTVPASSRGRRRTCIHRAPAATPPTPTPTAAAPWTITPQGCW